MANLLFHQGALGDWVLTFGLMRAMSDDVTAVTHWSKAQLAATVLPHVAAMDVELREFSRLFAAGGPAYTSPAIAGLFAEAQTIISFVSPGNDAWADNVRKLAPDAQLMFAFPRPPADFNGHVWQWHAQQLEKQGYLVEPTLAPARPNPDGPIVLHPGSGGKGKCWPLERFIELARRLRSDGHDVTAVLGEVEHERWQADAIAALADVCEVVTPPTLVALAETLSGARAFVGNDTGPTHLAAELGVPTASLFGPSNPTHWSPRGPQVTVLSPSKSMAMTWLTVDAVADRVRALLG